MKQFHLTLLCLMASLAPLPALAQASCSSIQNPDERYYCRATVNGNVADCSSIRDPDKRYYCRAVVTRKSIDCASIRDPDLRTLCRAQTR